MKLPSLPSMAPLPTPQQSESLRVGGGTPTGGFERLISQLIGSVNGTEAAANQAIQSLAAGDLEDAHQVSLAVAQADLSLRLALAVRNRLQEAYQEITRLQI